MLLDNRFRDHQPQSGSTGIGHHRVPATEKLGEELPLFLLGEPDTGVVHHDLNPIAGCHRPNTDFTLWGVLD